MIKSISISNYALIDRIEIGFEPGFNIITGETGAGKSIILGALGLLLGGRADSRAVRNADRKSVIEAIFTFLPGSEVYGLLMEHQLDADSDECILRREIAPGGRSRAFVNDTPVTLPVLKEIATRLVDIHSQHRNLLLASPDFQLEVIDSLAENGTLLARYSTEYVRYRAAVKRYTETRDLIQRNEAAADYLRFQYNQLEEAKLVAGEHMELEKERDILANVNEIKEQLSEALDPLTNDRPNALSLLRNAVSALEGLSSSLGNDSMADFRALAERLDSARNEVADIADTLMDYDASVGADPARLAEVEERLSMLYSLELKHHVDTDTELIAIRDRLATQLAALDDSSTVLADLELAAKRAKKAAITIANEISERRHATAEAFANQLRETAAPMGMHNLRCEVSITRGKLTDRGIDKLQFLFAFNKNQALIPVGDTASGGEISRLMLALKAIVAQRMDLPTIIFDEIDTGTSGNIASLMASLMAQISRRVQVITITHLPAVAAMGNSHYKVYKEDDTLSTTTHIQKLAQDERPAELALMIAGNADDPSALTTARTLLEAARINHQENTTL